MKVKLTYIRKYIISSNTKIAEENDSKNSWKNELNLSKRYCIFSAQFIQQAFSLFNPFNNEIKGRKVNL